MYRFLSRDTDGSASVEFALWFPFFFTLFGFVIDASSLMFAQTRFFDVARDHSRLVAINTLTASEAETNAVAAFPGKQGVTATVSTDTTYVTTTMTAPFSEFLIFGDVFFGSKTMTASITMVREHASSS